MEGHLVSPVLRNGLTSLVIFFQMFLLELQTAFSVRQKCPDKMCHSEQPKLRPESTEVTMVDDEDA